MRCLFTATALAGLVVCTPLMAQEENASETTGSPAAETSYDASTVLATVDGTEITLGHLIVLRSRLPQQYQQVPDGALFSGLLDQLIDQTLLSNAEKAQDGELPMDVELLMENEQRGALAAKHIETIIEEPLDEAKVRELYDQTFADFQPQPEYNAAHILVADEQAAKDLKAQLDEGTDFADLAKENSTDGSASNGGDLGWFGLGRMVPEFESAVADMEPGDVAGPVKTQFGYHLIKLIDTRESSPPPFEEVRAELEDQLRQQQVQEAVASLRQEAAIEQPETDVPPEAIRNADLISE
jgi:peptidyl-prolyl cis-trans isomerase C